MEILEAQRMLKSSPESDVERFASADAMAERIREWLDTPEGTMAHYPSWGHNLTPYKHDPLSKGGGLDVMIEMSIAQKLPIDIEDIVLKGVNVIVMDIDLFRLEIVYQFGGQTMDFSLQ